MTHTANPAALIWFLLVTLMTVNQANADPAAIRWFQDAGQPLNINEVLVREPDLWQSIAAGRGLNLGFSDSTYRIQVVVTPKSENQALEISYQTGDARNRVMTYRGLRTVSAGDR